MGVPDPRKTSFATTAIYKTIILSFFQKESRHPFDALLESARFFFCLDASGARFFTSLLFWRQIFHIPPFLTQDWRDSLWSCLAGLLLAKLVLVGHCCCPGCPGCSHT